MNNEDLEVFMNEWRMREDAIAKWKLIKFLAKLNLKTAHNKAGNMLVNDGTGEIVWHQVTS